MATGAKPALEPLDDSQGDKTGALNAPDAEPLTLGERILNKLSKIFEGNEHSGM